MTINLRDLVLKPRVVTVLVALRKGPRSPRALADAIGDQDFTDTVNLLTLMSRGIEGDGSGPKLVAPGRQARSYGLTHDGLGWLQSQGLDATPAAKQALYDATDTANAAEHTREVGRTTLDATTAQLAVHRTKESHRG